MNATGEQVADVGRGVSLAYEVLGDPAGPPLVLVAGLGQQLISWPDEFCRALTDRGYRLVRFDNRDIGRSTHLDFPPPGAAAILRGRWHPRQYDLDDLAADTIGLLDHLELPDAHLVGVSMGGMIAQTVAARYPDRARTLTSIMSTTGARRVGRPALSTWRLMAGRPPRTRDASVDRGVRIFRHIGSAGFPFDEAGTRDVAGRSWDRDPSPAGVARQLGAIFRSGDRTLELRGVRAPTLVVHGDRDLMVNPSGGVVTARAIAGARRETIPGMGHDLPRDAWPRLVELIADHISRSTDAQTTT